MSFRFKIDGVFVLAVTPFDSEGRVDVYSVDRMTDFYLGTGASAISILGLLGEASKLNEAESHALTKQVVRRAGSKPVFVSLSSQGFAAMRSLAHGAMDAGAAGVMIGPHGTLRTDDQILTYCRQAVETIGPDVPFILQDHPAKLQVVMSPSVIREIVQEHSSCFALKHEDIPGLEKISTLRGYQRDKSMRRIAILSGNGGLFLDLELPRGVDGAMSGYAFPEALIDVVRLNKANRRDDAQTLFDAHLPLLRYEQQTDVGLCARKYVLKKRGAIASDTVRKPASAFTAAARAEVDFLLARLARADKRAELTSKKQASRAM